MTRRSGWSEIVSRSDWIFAGACIAAAGFLAILMPMSAAPGQTVVFRQNGHVVRTVPLSEDTEVTLDGAYRNVFEISDGTVRVIYTDCPNHQCEHSGSVSKAGSAIVCVPNEVSASIEGNAAEVDAFTG